VACGAAAIRKPDQLGIDSLACANRSTVEIESRSCPHCAQRFAIASFSPSRETSGEIVTGVYFS